MNLDYGSLLWILLGVILVAAELFSAGFVLMWFGAGAFLAALANIAGVGYPFQLLVFFVFSILLTVASRTLFAGYFTRHGRDEGRLKTGMDALPGKVGTVVSSSKGTLHEGAVKVYGSTWTAFPSEGEEPLEAGDRVVVERVQGASIYVRRAPNTPGWRPPSITEHRNKGELHE